MIKAKGCTLKQTQVVLIFWVALSLAGPLFLGRGAKLQTATSTSGVLVIILSEIL